MKVDCCFSEKFIYSGKATKNRRIYLRKKSLMQAILYKAFKHFNEYSNEKERYSEVLLTRNLNFKLRIVFLE